MIMKEDFQFTEKLPRPFTGKIICENCQKEIIFENVKFAKIYHCENCGKKILLKIESYFEKVYFFGEEIFFTFLFR